MLKQYHAICNKKYRLFIWLIYPVAAIICCLALSNGFFGIKKELSFSANAIMPMLGSGILLVEIVSDFFLFPGIQNQSSALFPLLRCSTRGKKLLKNILVADYVRRLITYIVLAVVNFMISEILHPGMIFKEDRIILFTIIFQSAALCLIGLYICRFFNSIWVNIAIGYSAFILSFIMNYITSHSLSTGLWLTIYIVCSVTAIVLCVITCSKKLEESYYDRAN